MLEIFIGCGVIAALNEIAKMNDTHVKRGRDIFGRRYSRVSGPCFRCDGTGSVHGKTCRKCGGTGRYGHTTWY